MYVQGDYNKNWGRVGDEEHVPVNFRIVLNFLNFRDFRTATRHVRQERISESTVSDSLFGIRWFPKLERHFHDKKRRYVFKLSYFVIRTQWCSQCIGNTVNSWSWTDLSKSSVTVTPPDSRLLSATSHNLNRPRNHLVSWPCVPPASTHCHSFQPRGKLVLVHGRFHADVHFGCVAYAILQRNVTWCASFFGVQLRSQFVQDYKRVSRTRHHQSWHK